MPPLKSHSLLRHHRWPHRRQSLAARLGRGSKTIGAHPNTHLLQTYENLLQGDWRNTSGKRCARTGYWRSMPDAGKLTVLNEN
jgi:hypothetical protein